jgi:V-type H+-transporting ATPase subunit a
MVHKKIRIPRESANEILFALGKLKNAIEFEDLTKNDLEAKKSFGEMIKRCDEMKKRIDDFLQICKEFQVPLNKNNTFYDLNSRLSLDMQNRDKKFGSTYFDLIESEIMKNSRKINDLVDSHEQMRENLVVLIEKRHVLQKANELIKDSLPFGNFADSGADEDGILSSLNSNLVLMAGTVPTESEMKLKRMIFRISRGNATTTFYNLDIDKDEYIYTSTVRQRGFSIANMSNKNPIIHNMELYNNMNNQKKIFSVVFPGSSENVLLKKILKACEIFQASRYSVPKSSQILEELEALNADIRDKKSMLQSIEKTLNDLLKDLNKFQDINGYKYLVYKIFFEQQRLIYTNLGKCILRETFIDGRVWIPLNKLELIEQTLNNLFKDQENKLCASLTDIENEPNFNPPTLIVVNEFTSIPQLIVDTYGTPRYKEINPGYFTIITFPFLFGVMFGDIGHSLFLLCLAIYLFIYNKSLSKSTNSMVQTLAQSRYFVLLMGFFALYCGIFIMIFSQCQFILILVMINMERKEII